MNMKKSKAMPLSNTDKNWKRLWLATRVNLPFIFHGSVIQKKWHLPLADCAYEDYKNATKKGNQFLDTLYSQNTQFENQGGKDTTFEIFKQTFNLNFPPWINKQLIKYLQYAMPGQAFHLEVERLIKRCDFEPYWHYYIVYYLITGLINVPDQIDPNSIPRETEEKLYESWRIFKLVSEKNKEIIYLKSIYKSYKNDPEVIQAFDDFYIDDDKTHNQKKTCFNFKNFLYFMKKSDSKLENIFFTDSEIADHIYQTEWSDATTNDELTDKNFAKFAIRLTNRIKQKNKRFIDRHLVPLDPKKDRHIIEEVNKINSPKK
jgi:hypothetical protein